jgi:GDP-L-fucose synthase
MKIFLTGHNGFVGSAIRRKILKKKNFTLIVKNKNELNLLDKKKVNIFIKNNKPDAIIIASAKVGGILANLKNNEKFLYENLEMQNNLIHSAFTHGIKNLLFLGSSCVYPRIFRRAIKEKDILNGPLEKTNEGYAIAKIAGIKLCEYYSKKYNLNYKSLMPSNIYGPNDNFDLDNSHFFSAIIRKLYEAKIKKQKKVIFWGDGSPKRELVFVDDVADACLFFLKKKIDNLINIGSGKDYSIKYYVKRINKIINFKGKIFFRNKLLNGVPRKLLNISIAKKNGWKPKTSLDEGIIRTIKFFEKNILSKI